MLANKKIVVPTNLINLAKKTSLIPVGIVCAHHESTMISAKQAYELSLIEPIFIGHKELIAEEANKLNWNIDSFPNGIQFSSPFEGRKTGFLSNQKGFLRLISNQEKCPEIREILVLANFD